MSRKKSVLNEVPNNQDVQPDVSEQIENDSGVVEQAEVKPPEKEKVDEIVEISYPITGYYPYTAMENNKKVYAEAKKNDWDVVNIIHTASFTKATFKKKR